VADELAFVDTNILVYAHDASETTKQPIAQALLEELWADRSGAISTQVLQEFYSVATSRLHPPMTPAAARAVVTAYSAWPVVLIEPVLIVTASRLAEVRQLSFWDALIVEAARAIGADRVLSEDLNAGQDIDGIHIENPFRDASAGVE
jgi:predicted nucleic acid-binding protein